MTRVAIYARYSSDQQRDASIEDQFRLCRERAKREGWKVAGQYKDHAVSGASMMRGGIQRLLADAIAGKFEIILAEALDRSHAQVVAGIEMHDRGDQYLIKLRTTGDSELELWAAQRQTHALEQMLGKPVRLSADRVSYAEQPEHAARTSGQTVRGRGHRRIWKDDAAGAAGQVADRRRPAGVRHGMEFVGAREGGDEDGKEKEFPDADDLQSVTRH